MLFRTLLQIFKISARKGQCCRPHFASVDFASVSEWNQNPTGSAMPVWQSCTLGSDQGIWSHKRFSKLRRYEERKHVTCKLGSRLKVLLRISPIRFLSRSSLKRNCGCEQRFCHRVGSVWEAPNQTKLDNFLMTVNTLCISLGTNILNLKWSD